MYQKDLIRELSAALDSLGLECDSIEVSPPRDPSHGDASTNLALIIAKKAKRNPREVAQQLVDALELDESFVESIEIAGPGFLNFRFAAPWYEKILRQVVSEGDDYGSSDGGEGRSIQIEFVSANPTGPLNIVSARAAAVGDAMGRLLSATGAKVQREYYVNDAGRQVENLALSVDARVKEILGEEWEIPEGGYHGEYLKGIAETLLAGNPGLREMSVAERLEYLMKAATDAIVSEQRRDLENFGVEYDRWFYESELREAGAVLDVLDRLKSSGETYENEGATWLKTTPHGTNDDKVIVKGDGLPTYLLPDAAYHVDKFERGFDPVIDLWGPDHHAHIAEMYATLEILGYPRERLEVQIIQQVNFIEGGKHVKMSKRAGRLVTLSELVGDVGVDVAKFFFLMRKQASHLDFDLDLARKETDENPVFYVQYAHARVSSLIRFAGDRGQTTQSPDDVDLSDVGRGDACQLVLMLADFPRLIESAAEAREPHRLTTYLRDVSAKFHAYYHNNRIVTDDPVTTSARLFLSEATRTVLRSGLRLLGIAAPERM